METTPHSYQTSQLLRRFIPYYRPYWPILSFDLLCASLTTVTELTLPLIVRHLTSLATNDLASLTMEVILLVGALYVVLRLIDTAANYFMASVGHIMGAKIETDMRRDVFAKLQRLSHSFFDNAKVGQLMSRITNDLFEVTEFAHHCPEEFFIAALKISVSFVILADTNLLLTLIIFAIVPLMLFVTARFNHKLRSAFAKSRHKVGELNAQLEDSLLGVRVVKSFANESWEEHKFREGNEGFLTIKRTVYRYMAAFHSTTRLFDGAMYITVVVAGAIFLRNGDIDIADFMAFLLYISTLLTSIRRIVEFTEQFQRGMTGIQRFQEIMDTPIEIVDRPNAVELQNVQGAIVFDQVGFHYADRQDNVLSNISLRVQPGDHIALVGPSGSGKSTLCNLIPRFYEVTSGTISLDGHNIQDITLHSLRSNIGVVQQEVYLFSGSIRENIAYGKQHATDEEITEAAKLAGAHDFIQALPEGYDTYVGERGLKLSGGQKQRVSIARVFLKNPPVLILDEATSALDTESERIIQQSLERLAKGRTTFTIAHRLTTIRNANVILVLTEQGIVEQGSHRELLAKKGVYYHLYQMASDYMPSEEIQLS